MDVILPSNPLSPVQQDMDLIEILWRQDMDLGVSREAYDLNMRRQLEKDREIELQKQQQLEEFTNLNDLDSDIKKEQTVPSQSEDESITYVLDTETGEWEPAAQIEDGDKGSSGVTTLDESDGLSAEEAMLFLQTQLNQPSVGEDDEKSTASPASCVSPVPQVIISPVTPSTPASHGDGMDEDELEAVINVAEQMTADLQQQQITEEQQQQPQLLNIEPEPPIQRQSSFERNWEDIATLLNLAATNTSNAPAPVPLPPQNLTSLDMVPTNASLFNISSDSDMNPLIQNTTMVPPSEQSFNLSQPIDMPAMEPQVPVPTNGSMLTSPLEANPIQSLLNDTMPNPTANGMFNLDTDELIFPNLTAVKQEEPDYMLPMEVAESLNNTGANGGGGMLRQLMDAENNVESMELNETSLVEGLHRARMIDEVSSDSAVSSMGSSPPHNDFNETGSMMSNISSPFEGLEGATGGSDYDSGSDKYSPKLLSIGHQGGNGFFRFGSQRPNGRRHHSSMSNGSEGFGDFDGFEENDVPDMRHIKHNHTYTVPPGEAPKERKSDIKKKEKQANADKKTLSRDEKKAVSLKIPFTVDDIINSPVEEFNDMLQRHKLTEPQLQLIRDIRRRGKNKVAAQNCRKRKIDTIVTLEDEVIKLRAERERLVKERRMIDKQKMELQTGMNTLYKEVFSSLRDDNGEPYDPTQYTLEQTSDGNVILIPTNGTVINDHVEKNSRKRKGGNSKKQK